MSRNSSVARQLIRGEQPTGQQACGHNRRHVVGQQGRGRTDLKQWRQVEMGPIVGPQLEHLLHGVGRQQPVDTEHAAQVRRPGNKVYGGDDPDCDSQPGERERRRRIKPESVPGGSRFLRQSLQIVADGRHYGPVPAWSRRRQSGGSLLSLDDAILVGPDLRFIGDEFSRALFDRQILVQRLCGHVQHPDDHVIELVFVHDGLPIALANKAARSSRSSIRTQVVRQRQQFAAVRPRTSAHRRAAERRRTRRACRRELRYDDHHVIVALLAAVGELQSRAAGIEMQQLSVWGKDASQALLEPRCVHIRRIDEANAQEMEHHRRAKQGCRSRGSRSSST